MREDRAVKLCGRIELDSDGVVKVYNWTVTVL